MKRWSIFLLLFLFAQNFDFTQLDAQSKDNILPLLSLKHIQNFINNFFNYRFFIYCNCHFFFMAKTKAYFLALSSVFLALSSVFLALSSVALNVDNGLFSTADLT